MKYRIEKDSMGEISVPYDRYWGAQTQRSCGNFFPTLEKMPMEMIYGLAVVKKAAALTNCKTGKLDKKEKISSSPSVTKFWRGNWIFIFLWWYGRQEAVRRRT